MYMIGRPEGGSENNVLNDVRSSGDTIVLNMKENIEQGKTYYMFKELHRRYHGKYHFGMKVCVCAYIDPTTRSRILIHYCSWML